MLTPRNQSDTAPWSVVRDVTFTNNTVRNVAAVFNILGRDYNNPSQIVISAAAYAGRSPGGLTVDTTIVPTSLGTDTGLTAVHTYRHRGTYPLRLWVTDSVGQETSTLVQVR